MEIDDAQIGQNVARARGAMSQKDLAMAMRKRGHKWSQATVWNVERGERPLRLSEASALAEILHVLSIHSFTVTDLQHQVFSTLTLVGAAQTALEQQAEHLLSLQRQLAHEADGLVAQHSDALDAGELDRSVRYSLGLMPVELMRDVESGLLYSLRAKEEQPGPYTQTLIEGLEAIKWTVDE